MNGNVFLRQSHRWLSIVFTLTVIANFAAIFSGQTLEWLYYLPLPPLFLLMFTGLYLFFRPYFRKRATSLEAK
jgi:hypothetical protein